MKYILLRVVSATDVNRSSP